MNMFTGYQPSLVWPCDK